MAYFNDVTTLEELRKQYKALLKLFHPDMPNGSEETCKSINTEYEQLFKKLKDIHDNQKSRPEAEQKTTYYNDAKYNTKEDEQLRNILNRVISLLGINIEIIGNWIWIDGNTYQHRLYLKELGFKWASEKKRWYYHTDTFRKRSRKTLSVDRMRDLYGSTSVRRENRKLLEA